MRAVQVVAPGKIQFVEIQRPALVPGHVLVRPRYLSLCGSDVHMVYYGDEHDYPHAVGSSGHEMVGVVEAVDAPGCGIQVGDWALTLSPPQLAMTECFLAPADHVFVLPPNTAPQLMLQAQQLGTVIFSCKRLPNVLGKTVAVIGQGSAGLYFDFMLRRMGASTVIGIDLQAARVAVASQFGATHTVHNQATDAVAAVAAITQGQLADIVIEAAGDPAAINLVPHLVKRYGHILYFGMPRAQTFPFDFGALYTKYCHTISNSGTAFEPGHLSTRQALQLIASGEIDVELLLTHRFPFDRVMDAYALAHARGDNCIKILVEIPGSDS
ncbi:MAG: zinc-binding dehydrogenase [Caldilineaceae bacterium]|nr:zinc-binding dehydrogenase [Caldilineaceae bacterium]